ncbi:CLUMA_CG005830, isoform A [Clunio marinus]|uniref:CLUMA_CG005830, isoform A n=1 Tax=Clunio marinus TaxID=568069 RepID=A0A1J1HW49_9DIPT|nr:CLUMA_CG005830, isoform A [Clunio marinus]
MVLHTVTVIASIPDIAFVAISLLLLFTEALISKDFFHKTLRLAFVMKKHIRAIYYKPIHFYHPQRLKRPVVTRDSTKFLYL